LKEQTVLYFLGNGSYFLSHRLPTAQAASSLGYEIHVVAIDNGFADLFAGHGITLHPRFLQRDTWPIFSTILGFFQLLALCLKIRPTLVHVIGLKSSPVGLLVSLLWRPGRFLFSINGLGFLFSLSNHSIFHRLTKSAVIMIFGIVSKLRNIEILFQNEDDRRFFANSALLRHTKSHLVRGSGVCMTHYAVTPLPPLPITFGIACRMIKIKGVEDMIDAFDALLDEGLPIRLLIAGDVDYGNPSSLTSEFLSAATNRDQIEWGGFVDDMRAFWSQCHVACLPSHGGEGVPMALLMAASMGRALLASDTNGNRDIVIQGENGFLSQATDIESLKQAIRSFMDVDLAEFGQASRQIILNQKMDTESVQLAFEKIYKR
jgi:glycosyltransferase involved in cell wall biosynthesis